MMGGGFAEEEPEARAKPEFKHLLAADFGTCPDGHKALKDVPIVYGRSLLLYNKKPEDLNTEERELLAKQKRGEIELANERHENSPETRVVCSQCGFSYQPAEPAEQFPGGAWVKLRTQHAKPRSPRRRKLYGISNLPEQQPDSPPRQPTRPPEGNENPEDRIEQVNEGKGTGRGYTFETGAKGHGGGIVPSLSATDGEVLVTGRFDGRDGLIMLNCSNFQ